MDKKIKKIKELIDCVRLALNNEKTVWNKDGIFSNCSYLRYLVTLYWATLNPVYLDDSFTIYKLDSIAKQLNLNFDKSKKSWNVYADCEERKEVEFGKKDNNVMYFLITENGMSMCEDRLEILCETVRDLKGLFETDKEGIITKGVRTSEFPKGLLRKIQKISREI